MVSEYRKEKKKNFYKKKFFEKKNKISKKSCIFI